VQPKLKTKSIVAKYLMLIREITEDLSRRGFLQGMAGAALGATGVANAKQSPASPVVTTGLSMQSGPEHALQRAALASGIRGVELAQFMAQVRHESADFSRMKEIGGRQYFAQHYDPKFAPQKARILGNTHHGDGERYHGRGFIQITGRSNYAMASDAIGIDLVNHPELAAKPEIAAKIAVWYWKTRVKPNVHNFNDTAAVTKFINPALRGLKDRLQHFKDYKLVMNV
jgi:predicted chitinase